MRTLSVVLSEAVESGFLAANPALRIGKYLRRGDEPETENQPLTRSEVNQLLVTAADHFPRWYPLLLCAVRTGMRQGELLGLQWSDVDFSGGSIQIRRNLVRGVLTTPKTRKGRRRVDMSQQLAETLLTAHRLMREQCLAEGRPEPEWVFSSSVGTALDEANVRHMFYRILAKAELRRVRFHDLRHTYASLLIQQRESLAYVREQLGHSSISVTVDVYGHLVPWGKPSRSGPARRQCRCNNLQPIRNWSPHGRFGKGTKRP